MFAPDRPLALREARRLLGPGGTLLLSTWAPIDRNPVVRIAHETILEYFPDDPPRFYETPFSLGDPHELSELLEGAGLDDVRVETVRLTGEARSARSAAAGLVDGNPVADAILARDPAMLPVVRGAVERKVAEAFGVASLRVPLEALIATATA